jgi:hypothetical protein
MNLINLKEFQKITRVSDKTLVLLLSNGALPISLGADSKIMIDMNSVEIKKLVVALNRELSKKEEEEFSLMVEEAGNLIREEFDSLINAASVKKTVQ